MILDSHCQELPVSVIARRTGVDRKTVRKYIKASLEPPHYGPHRPDERCSIPIMPTCVSG